MFRGLAGGANMAHGSWGPGISADTDTGILDVLLAFVSQGGQLYGARRFEDNPLTLTHVRWQGPSGGVLDAFRQPGGTVGSDDVESTVWVQLALNFPSAHPSPAGADAPWLPLTVDPATASQWVAQLRQSHALRRSRLGVGTRQMHGPDSMIPSDMISRAPEDLPSPWRRPADFAAGASTGSHDVKNPFGVNSANGSLDPEAPAFNSPPDIPKPAYQTQHGASVRGDVYDTSQWTGEYKRPYRDGVEIAVLPCIEVDLPTLLNNPTSVDYHRDFARDVAVHFRQALQQFPEVREVRGWMRGERLVLAARFMLRTGARTPKQAEMDQVAQLLSDALADRKVPYAYLGFADSGEWMQGRPLPES
ncbi:MAG: hypothetical protein C5B60_02335 [Chloroflexi bacterium]|nr:MAG: hypothetical protein C5B60_02335 [Chloroflexota bacterium]